MKAAILPYTRAALKRAPTPESIFAQGLPEFRPYRAPTSVRTNWAWRPIKRAVRR